MGQMDWLPKDEEIKNHELYGDEYFGTEAPSVMYELKPVGRHSISVCTNISCMLCGGDDILAHIEGKLGIKVGESTPDGKFFLKREEECLAACCGAPMMQVNHVYHENLTPEKVDQILDSLE